MKLLLTLYGIHICVSGVIVTWKHIIMEICQTIRISKLTSKAAGGVK